VSAARNGSRTAAAVPGASRRRGDVRSCGDRHSARSRICMCLWKTRLYDTTNIYLIIYCICGTDARTGESKGLHVQIRQVSAHRTAPRSEPNRLRPHRTTS
jgi:hypothetical protein